MVRFGLASLMFFSALAFADDRQMRADADGADQANAGTVVIFSSTYCPNCLYVKKFLSGQGISYQEFDIETSAAARTYFEKLGGRGTPFLLVNNQPVQGFSEKAFWHYYENY